MILVYSFVTILVGIAFFKMLNTWKLSAEILDKQSNLFVRSIFGSADFVANLVSLKIFK